VIAADTSTWIAFLEGHTGTDTDLLDEALAGKQVLMCPVVLTELLSDPKLDSQVGDALSEITLMGIRDGFGVGPVPCEHKSWQSGGKRGSAMPLSPKAVLMPESPSSRATATSGPSPRQQG
jgi:hypothetical protein